jgi:hypothetical protein
MKRAIVSRSVFRHSVKNPTHAMPTLDPDVRAALTAESNQAWEHYRHIENQRNSCIGFFLTAVLGFIALIGTISAIVKSNLYRLASDNPRNCSQFLCLFVDRNFSSYTPIRFCLEPICADYRGCTQHDFFRRTGGNPYLATPILDLRKGAIVPLRRANDRRD